jgi:putative transposase
VPYAGRAHRRLLERHGITRSMSRSGNCYDNAVVMESFFGSAPSIKTELVNEQTYQTHEQARGSIFEYLEGFYNRARKEAFLTGISESRTVRTASPRISQ